MGQRLAPTTPETGGCAASRSVLFAQHGALFYEWVRAGERLTMARNGARATARTLDCYPTPKAWERAFAAFVAERDAANDVYFTNKTLRDFEAAHGTFGEEYVESEREWEQCLFDDYPV